MRAPLLALLTDFGLSDPYVGIMKAVILARCPGLALVDLTHDVPPQDLRWGAFLLRGALPFLPPRSVVLAVVDPGVGSARALLCAEAQDKVFIAPDNGLLPLALADCEAKDVRWYRVDLGRGFGLPERSATFHGRDLFAPLAASLAAGTRVERWAVPIPHPLRLPEPAREHGPDAWSGVIVVVDRYGNLISDLRPPDDEDGGAERVLELPGHWSGPLSRTYSDVEPGSFLAYVGSYGTYEIAVREGSAAERLKLKAGASVVLRWRR